MNDINDALSDYEVALGSPLDVVIINAQRARFQRVIADAVEAARVEGRATGLEEAAREVENARAKTPGMRMGLAVVAGRIRSLATSDGAGKVEGGTLPAWGADRDRES